MWNRRSFLATAGAAALSGRLTRVLGAETFAAPDDDAVERLRPYFDCPDPALWRFAVEIYKQCALRQAHPMEPPFLHRWLDTGGPVNGESVYNSQGLWDAMFVVDLLAILPDQKQLIREVFQNYWDYQARWDAVSPDFAQGMIACMLLPDSHVNRRTKSHVRDWLQYPAYSQIPILAWGLERVYQRNKDLELVRNSVRPLERFHEWYWRERDLAQTGLIGVGAYSSVTQEARYETFDFECDLDTLAMTPHPTRKAGLEGYWYGDISIPGNTAYLILAEQCLVRLSQAVGDAAAAQRRQARIEKGIAAMRKHMWDEKAGCFLAVKRDSLEKIRVPTIGSWIALHAGVPTAEMAQRMAEMLATDNWMTPLPVPTVGRNDPRWKSDDVWRGDVWPATNYQIASGLAQYGHKDLAAKIVDASVANALKVGIYERYDSLSGQPMGVPGLGMSCTLLTMVLDGLSRRYSVKTVMPKGTIP